MRSFLVTTTVLYCLLLLRSITIKLHTVNDSIKWLGFNWNSFQNPQTLSRTHGQCAEFESGFCRAGQSASKNNDSNAPQHWFCVQAGWGGPHDRPPTVTNTHLVQTSVCVVCCKAEHHGASQRLTLPPVSLGRLCKQTAPCPNPTALEISQLPAVC